MKPRVRNEATSEEANTGPSPGSKAHPHPTYPTPLFQICVRPAGPLASHASHDYSVLVMACDEALATSNSTRKAHKRLCRTITPFKLSPFLHTLLQFVGCPISSLCHLVLQQRHRLPYSSYDGCQQPSYGHHPTFLVTRGGCLLPLTVPIYLLTPTWTSVEETKMKHQMSLITFTEELKPKEGWRDTQLKPASRR